MTTIIYTEDQEPPFGERLQLTNGVTEVVWTGKRWFYATEADHICNHEAWPPDCDGPWWKVGDTTPDGVKIEPTELMFDGVTYAVGQSYEVGNGGRVVITSVDPGRITMKIDYVIPMEVTPEYLAGRGKLVT